MELVGCTQAPSYNCARPKTSHFLPPISTMASSYCNPQQAMPFNPTISSWRANNLCKGGSLIPTPPSIKIDNCNRIRAKTAFYPTNRAMMSNRYTQNDWYKSNQNHYQESECYRRTAESLRKDTIRLIQDKEQFTRRTQETTSKDISERVKDIKFWKSELTHEIDNMMAETSALNEMKRRLERALAESQGPLQVAQECLYHREKRMCIDLVHDDVEKELVKEMNLITSCQERMRCYIDKAMDQLAANRAALHELEKDLCDKVTAQKIDDKCHHLRNTSEGIGFFKGVDRIDHSLSMPESWCNFTDSNILRSQSERATSCLLREEIEIQLNTMSNEMWSQFNNTNVAFTKRIAETSEAKNNLQAHLAKTMQEIFQTEMLIESLKKAIRDKENPLKVAQTRMEERIHRPNIELCRDNPHHSLVCEVRSIEDTISRLHQRLMEAENTLQALLKTKVKLETDLSVKANTLFLDQERCMGIRKTFPSMPRLTGYT